MTSETTKPSTPVHAHCSTDGEQPETPLDWLTLATLEFLLERTDFSEPYLGIGFATSVQEALEAAKSRKIKSEAQIKEYAVQAYEA